MNFLILEKYPEIKLDYLAYLEEKWYKLLSLEDKFKQEDIDWIIIRSKVVVDKKLLDKYPNIKYILRVWVGLEKVDLILCKQRWIKVLNTPWVNANSVADLVITWMLNLSRKLYLNNINIDDRFEYMWSDLAWKSVWIIGFWNIWKQVYKRLLGFWINNFLIYDPFLKKEDIEKIDFCKKLEDKEDIFKGSDIITFHIPFLESTRNFLWKREISLLKKDVKVINTSRWWIIDELELIKFLKENKESWFFTDVWEEEPLKPKKDLVDLKNVIITPHIWAMTRESEEKMHFFLEI